MEPVAEYVQVDETKIGLDRSIITQQGQIQLPPEDFAKIDDGVLQLTDDKDDDESYSRSSSHHMVESIKQRKHHVGVKLRKTFHISKTSEELECKAPVLADAAKHESDSRLTNELPEPEKPTLKDFVHHPVDTVKSKVSNQGNQEVAANIAAKEISHGQEVDLVNAQSAVERARTEQEKLLAIQDLHRLMKERQDTFVRWTFDRHLTKVRVLPRDTVVKKPRANFEKIDTQGQRIVDWKAYGQHLITYYAHQYGGQYIGYGSDPPKPSKQTIIPNIERLIVATSPLQEFIMTTRRVYRWEDRMETTKYLLIYLILWYFDLLLPGILSAMLYLVVERRIHGNTLEDLREDIKHRENMRVTALSLTEFIEKEGDEKWADEILQTLGPWLMVQLADMANFFESARNFYEWRKPTRTLSNLIAFALFIIITVFVPIQLLIKCSTLGAGFVFFALFPIAVNFPEYRLLVSPSKRIFWNIPTHSEWAIKYIQAEGSRLEEHLARSTSTPPPSLANSNTDGRDIGFYNAHHGKMTGHLIVNTASVRFVSNIGHKVHFSMPYNYIQNLEKQDRVVAKSMPKKLVKDSGKDLRLVSKSGEEVLLHNVDKRDEAFSQIVGFSQTTWQVLW